MTEATPQTTEQSVEKKPAAKKTAVKKPAAKKPAAKKTTTKSAAPKKRAAPIKMDLHPRPLAFEVFDLVSRLRTKAKKVEALKKYEDISLKALLIWNFDESIVSALPEGEVPYAGYDEQTVYNGSLSQKIEESARQMFETGSFSLGNIDANARTTIRAQWKNLYHFVEGGNGGLSKGRREMMFINLLESVHPLEAEILVLIKDKKLTDKYKIPMDVVKQAYPDISWGGRGW